MTYSFDPRSDISKIYKAITGKEIDPNRGFDSNEINRKISFLQQFLNTKVRDIQEQLLKILKR